MNTARENLRRDFGGTVVEPDDPGYAAAGRTVMASGRPALVLRPGNTADVQAAVRFAAATGLPPAVRGGGHSFPGFGTNDGGVVIDLGALADVHVVDAARHLVRIGGGANWGQVAAALTPHGLAISSGDTRSVGVGGLTLSGGIGWKVRKYGLALDSLVAAQVVTADGRVLRASAEENPDLFWAIRGGGGGFGIVTAFDFAAHPTKDIHFGRLVFPAAQAAGVLQGWAECLAAAPDELTSIVDFANPFAGGPQAPVEIRVAVDSDDPDRAARIVAPFRGLGTVIADEIARVPYADVLVDGATPPPGIALVTRSAFAERESVPGALGVLAEIGAAQGSPFLSVRSVGGAVSRVADDATAYAHRRAELMIVTTVLGPTAAVDAARPALAENWRRLAPHVRGAYANFLSTADDEDVAAVYPPETYKRLAAVKAAYDPRNLFAGNHNIRPQ